MPLVYSGVALVLVIAVVAVAYGVGAPSLGVAEFAPSAQSEVSAPPTSGGQGAGGQAARSRRSTTTQSAQPTGSGPGESGAPPTTTKSRGRPCFGNPPQQTFDPMSPPCIPTIFEGENGGATSRGVTQTEIRVAMPSPNSLSQEYRDVYEPAMDLLIDSMNRSFEFYGRRIVPLWLETSGYAGTPVESRALATDVASNNVFATVTAAWESGYGNLEPAFVQELARQKVVSITHNANLRWSDEAVYDFAHPYAWSVFPSQEDRQRNFADFACTTMAGKRAQHAGDPTLAQSMRKFGIFSLGNVVPPSTKLLARALEACTGEAPMVVQTLTNDSTARRAALDKLKLGGVTTLFCTCAGYSMVDYAFPEAASIKFFPEWVVENRSTGSSEFYFQYNHAQGRFGTSGPISVHVGPKLMPVQGRLWFQSISALGGGLLEGTNLTRIFTGAEMLYDSLIVLASGIQAAGPNLTPESFAEGLMNTQFPNTGAGAPPYWQPKAGFGPGDHSFYDDYAVAWWNPELPALDVSTYRPTGSWCYLDGGARFDVGSYPKDADDRLFKAGEVCR